MIQQTGSPHRALLTQNRRVDTHSRQSTIMRSELIQGIAQVIRLVTLGHQSGVDPEHTLQLPISHDTDALSWQLNPLHTR
jgi:hypothetical protein